MQLGLRSHPRRSNQEMLHEADAAVSRSGGRAGVITAQDREDWEPIRRIFKNWATAPEEPSTALRLRQICGSHRPSTMWQRRLRRWEILMMN